ncbi:hypothetical protein [Massilia niabensis]|uniref:Uncharacterized protein n=1 Tax=Massilia niabensis TaxID=544910 RepID=A0ABW0L511_9BURK
MNSFAAEHQLILGKTERELSASFEIGCLHALLNLYKNRKYTVTPENLKENSYRYLTTPSGNPTNFSYVTLKGSDGDFEVRQQVRIASHVDPDIQFTPDIVVIVKGAPISGVISASYANGKRALFSVKSELVVAAHECKSMNPFPELMVSFIGMLVTAHKWHPNGTGIQADPKGHLAPTLFVGGTARALHLDMIKAMQTAYNLNIVVGMHSGTWSLKAASNGFRWLGGAMHAPAGVPLAQSTVTLASNLSSATSVAASV